MTGSNSNNHLNRRQDNHPRRLPPFHNDNDSNIDLSETDQTLSSIDKHHRQQRQPSPTDYLNSIPSPSSSQQEQEPTTGGPFVLLHRPNQQVNSFSAIPSLSEPSDYNSRMHLPTDNNGGDNNDNDDDATWLVAVVLTTALLITLASVIRSCGQKAGWLPLSMHSSQDGHESLLGGPGGGHGPGGGPSRYHSSGPHQVPSEDEPDPDSTLNENDERWALLTDAQRQAYTSSRGKHTTIYFCLYCIWLGFALPCPAWPFLVSPSLPTLPYPFLSLPFALYLSFALCLATLSIGNGTICFIFGLSLNTSLQYNSQHPKRPTNTTGQMREIHTHSTPQLEKTKGSRISREGQSWKHIFHMHSIGGGGVKKEKGKAELAEKRSVSQSVSI
jgi:hypothetical protein